MVYVGHYQAFDAYLLIAVPINISKNVSHDVRQETAELASWALSDIGSSRSNQTPTRYHAISRAHHNTETHFKNGNLAPNDPHRHESHNSPRPHAIQELSEPPSPASFYSSQDSRCQSTLTELIKNSTPIHEDSHATDQDLSSNTAGLHPVTVGEGIMSQPSERTALLKKRTAYSSVKDLERQRSPDATSSSKLSLAIQSSRNLTVRVLKTATHPKSWNARDFWMYGIRAPASLVPPVILGLLLNVLDALSYGRIACVQSSVHYRLTCCRNDLVSTRPQGLCRPWIRWSFYVLCQLHSITIGVLLWR